ncbi:MAG: hypothetical protein ACREJN_21790 [Nitrospiraceae bacterium]
MMRQTYSPLDSVIQQQLRRIGSCSLDDLATKLADYSWAQVFAAVDRLTRTGVVSLRHPAPLQYVLSHAPDRSIEAWPVPMAASHSRESRHTQPSRKETAG